MWLYMLKFQLRSISKKNKEMQLFWSTIRMTSFKCHDFDFKPEKWKKTMPNWIIFSCKRNYSIKNRYFYLILKLLQHLKITGWTSSKGSFSYYCFFLNHGTYKSLIENVLWFWVDSKKSFISMDWMLLSGHLSINCKMVSRYLLSKTYLWMIAYFFFDF